MDLGCIDMGCVEKPRKDSSAEKEYSPKESVTSATKLGKNSKAKDAVRSSLTALNRLTSQISKPPRRKASSPLNWFPRKKIEPYLNRKLKMLQEVDGMRSTLDETLGDSNPHYSRVLREKMAIREAAEKAMEARKAAMVAASWCRILQAARIESKEAEAQLLKAEVSAAEAIEAAREVGVIMNYVQDSAQNQFRIETIAAKEGSTSHNVSATFETPFEVDKQVAAAVKAAFIKLASCASIDNKDEFKDLLRKISENPDITDENCSDLSGFVSECESDTGSEIETALCKDGLMKQSKRQEMDKFSMDNIVEMMLGRLQCLKEDQLASLATIVATSGLNAALSETVNIKQETAVKNTENHCPKVSRRTSVCGRTARGRGDAELPSLDKFLVKRLTRLEREVLEAKSTRKNESEAKLEVKHGDGAMIPDLGSVLMKRSSKLEKEIEEAKINRKSFEKDSKRSQKEGKQDGVDVLPSLDKYLVKRLTRLEREVQEAKKRNRVEPTEKTNSEEVCSGDFKGKENEDLNRMEDRNSSKNSSHGHAEEKQQGRSVGGNYESLDKVLVKKVSRLEKEKSAFCGNEEMRVKLKRKDTSETSDYESLDKVLVKHVSRLEKEKSEFSDERVKVKRKDMSRELESNEGSLEQVLAQHKSRLEMEKTAAAEERVGEDRMKYSVNRRRARERELQEAWGGLSLGNSIRPHVSRLQREKAAWLKAEEEDKSMAAATEGGGGEVCSK